MNKNGAFDHSGLNAGLYCLILYLLITSLSNANSAKPNIQIFIIFIIYSSVKIISGYSSVLKNQKSLTKHG